MDDVFFKGYVQTKNKQCCEKFKGRTDFKTHAEVQSLDEYAGILAEDAVLVDVDDAQQADILMTIVEDLELDCRVYKTTRGRHFLFYNKEHRVEQCYTGVNLACGITADIKCGLKASYEVLKFAGKDRPIEWDFADDEVDVDYQEIPMWLVPVKTNTDFLSMGAGDGRNQALFNYILTLQSNGFAKDDARVTIRILNKYILKESLSDAELDVIMRDEAFAKPVFYKGSGKAKTFCHDKFAQFLVSEHHIKRINGQLHIYKDGIYISGQEEIESLMIRHIPGLTRAKRQEVLAYLDILIRDNSQPASPNIIAFKNGLYDMTNDSFSTFSPDVVVTNVIPWDYNPNAYSDLADKTLDNISCHDESIRHLLEEMIGSCFYRSNNLAGGKFFILVGSGANGKSTYYSMVRNLLGEDNTSVLDLRKVDDRFSTIMMFRKLANIGDDISDEFISDTSCLKKIVTGETIDAEQKGQPKFNFKPFCKLLFSANCIPRIGKGRDSTALIRRMVIIPFSAHFTPDDPDYDPFLEDKLCAADVMSYLIRIGLEGLRRVLDTQHYTINDAVTKELEEFAQDNNPLLGWFKQVEEDGIHIEDNPTSEVYSKYNEWCLANNVQPISQRRFTRSVKTEFGFENTLIRLNGKPVRVFRKPEAKERKESDG